MMKRITVLLLSAAALVVAGTAAQAAPIVTVNSAATADGAVVTVDIVANAQSDTGYQLELSFDSGSAAVSVIDHTPNNFFLITAPNCTATSCVGSNGGNFVATAWHDSTSTFTITGLNAGDVINFNFGLSTGSALVAELPTGSFSETVIPEPTTAGLLGFGLMGLAMAGRRR